MAKNNNFRSIKGGKPAVSGNNKKKPMLPMLANDELEKQIDTFREGRDPLELIKVMETLRTVKVFFPATRGENGAINFSMMNDNEGKKLVPVFSSTKELVKSGAAGGILVIPYTAVNALIYGYMKENPVDGIVINPMGNNLRLTVQAIEAIESAEKRSRETGEHVPMDLQIAPAPKTTLPADMPKLNNEQIDPLIDAFGATEDKQVRTDVLNRLLTALYKANVVLKMQATPDGKEGHQVFIDDGIKRLAIYTSPEALMKHPLNKTENPVNVKVGVLPFERACAIAMESKDGLSGIKLIGQSSKAINMENRLLENVKKVNEEREKALAMRPENMSGEELEKLAQDMENRQMSEAERAALEHQKFELAYLPMTLFDKGQEFVDELCTRKEAFVDEQFEEAYYDTMMYPYLEEEFAVLAVQTEDLLEAIRIDFPERDQTMGCVSRSYIIWDNKTSTGKYYALVRGAKESHSIMEITSEGKPVPHGPAPAEGTELATIIELAKQ